MTARDDTHEVYAELAAGHALSALEPADEQAFLAHLPGCAGCARAIAEHTETLAHLAYGADAAEPPPALLAGIRAGVEASGRAGAFPAPVSLDAAREKSARGRSLRERGTGRHRTVRATTALVGAAAALVMVAALFLVNRGLQSTNDDLQAADQKLSSAVQSLLRDGSRQVDLAGEGGLRAVAVLNAGTVSLVMEGAPANDRSSSVYVLWERSRFGDVRAVGTFDVRSTDITVVNDLRLSDGGDNLLSLIVTREQGRTAPPIAKGSLVVKGDV